MGVRLNWVELISRRKTSRFASHNKGVGTAGATGALAPGMLKPRVRKLLLVCTQFCIAGLQKSAPKEPIMHQNSWWPGSLQRSPGPLAGE